ncbi:MAG: hypothetical protein DI537_10810 [Stutzerimonas stutzeri]|nr:MAG: hypothetical protein DI537_10810 [Stutzerimonas stutzeri]
MPRPRGGSGANGTKLRPVVKLFADPARSHLPFVIALRQGLRRLPIGSDFAAPPANPPLTPPIGA